MIEVGEYVRLARNQGINKIIDKDDDDFLILDEIIADEYGDECFEISLQDVDKEIIKHSKNIIDLIEVGDYVNGNEVLDKYLLNGEIPVLETTGDETNVKCMCEGDIRIILTKEQYKANCYTVERKKEC